jgi:hypothetical protein
VVEGISEELLAFVKSQPFVRDAEYRNSELLVAQDEPERDNPLLVSELVRRGAKVKWVTEEKASLEDIYLELVNQNDTESPVTGK